MPYRKDCGNCKFWGEIWGNLGMCTHPKKNFHTFVHEKCPEHKQRPIVLKRKRKRVVKIHAIGDR